MSASIQGPAVKAFKAPTYPRFAATVNNEGVPNVVPLLSAKMVEPQKIAFVRFMVWKTARNFESNQKITFACSGPGGRSYAAKCEFEGWVREGPLLEEFEREAMYRYNAYTGANEVGVVRVKEVLEFPGTGFLGPALIAWWSRLFSGKNSRDQKGGGTSGKERVMPVQVVEKWRRVLAIKFMGMVDQEGYPIAFPLQGLSAPDPWTLTFPLPRDRAHPVYGLSPGDPVAASVLVFDPVAYQVKGRFSGIGTQKGKKAGLIEVSEVYSAVPPVPGKRIFPPEPLPADP